MAAKSRRNRFSIRESIILCLLLCIIPVNLFFIAFSSYSIRSHYNKIEASYRMSIDNEGVEFERLFAAVEFDLANIYINSLNVRYLKDASEPIPLYHYRYSLINEISDKTDNQMGISFVYAKGSFQFSAGAGATSAERLSYSSFFRHLQEQEKLDTSGWYLDGLDDSRFLVRILGNEDVHIGKVVMVNDNLVDAVVSYSEEQILFFSDKDSAPITGKVDIRENMLISLDSGLGNAFFLFPDTSYFTVEHRFSVIPVNIVCAVPANSFVAEIRVSQWMFFGLLCLSVGSVIITLIFIHRRVTVPLNNLRGNILSLQNSNYELRSGDGAAKEIQQVYDTFNSMTDQIKALRIKTYEEQILKQKYQLEYYQLQLKPHFYLNSLKSLYGLAESGKTEDMQKMLLSLSEQFKYIAYDITTMIPLGSELNRMRNYVNIQKIGKGFPVHISLSVENDLINQEVPSLILQTFVENAIKHAPVQDETLRISVVIQLERMDEKAYMHVTVSDNGIGYPENVLEDFYKESEEEPKGHIGLANLKQRLKLIYGEDAYFVIGNNGGAVSEIFLPIKDKEGNTNGDTVG